MQISKKIGKVCAYAINLLTLNSQHQEKSAEKNDNLQIETEIKSIKRSIPPQSRQLTLWQTELEIGDWGHPFKWRKHDADTHKIKPQEHGIIFASYNCWRNSFNIKNRCEHLKLLLLRSPADIICLQETSPYVIRELMGVLGIMDKFIFSDSTVLLKQSYSHKDGLLTLFRRRYNKVHQTYNIPFSGPNLHVVMQCSFVTCRFTSQKAQNLFMIINIHATVGRPKTILQKLEEMLNSCYNHASHKRLAVIMMGDLIWGKGREINEEQKNEEEDKEEIKAIEEEEETLLAQYGWTDAAVKCNMNVLSTSTGLDIELSRRPDRILYKQFPTTLLPVAVNVFGKEIILDRKNTMNTYASTHLGVAAHFQF